jgi:nucleoside-diphosphate-sugar epimerase
VPTSLRELADTVLDVVGDPALRWDREPARGFDVPHTWLDVTLAADVLGWVATTALPDGLAAAWRSVGSVLPEPAGAGTSTEGPQ